MGPPPAVPVSVAKAELQSAPSEVRVVGTAEASAVIQVKAQIGGELLRANFTEGQNVERGATLFEIDSRQYRDALRQAEAAVERDRALIRQAEATLARDVAQTRHAETDAARDQDLSKEGLAPRSQYDSSRTNLDVLRESVRASQASIESARAALESDLAAVERARLDISFCQILSPIAGRTGNLLVHAGNLVKANDAPLVVIHQVTPIFVSFSVPEEHLTAVRRISASGKLPVRVFTRELPARAATGFVSVVDNTVDASTGTIRLKATIDNRDGLLWPGQFVDVVLTLDTLRNATMVPSEAVQAGQQGQFLYVVKANNTVEPRVVTTGRAFDGKIVIEKGVAPGETVVTDGQLRLFPGATIQAVDASKLETGQL